MTNIRIAPESQTIYIAVRAAARGRRFLDFGTVSNTLQDAIQVARDHEEEGSVPYETKFVGIQPVKLTPTQPIILVGKLEQEKPTLRLYAQPGKPKAWWPRKSGKPAWVGVLAGGCGWVVGEGDLLNVDEAVRAAESLGDDICKPRFRVTGPERDRKRLAVALREGV